MEDVKKAAGDVAQTVDKGLEEASKAVRRGLAWTLEAAKDGVESGKVVIDSGKVRGTGQVGPLHQGHDQTSGGAPPLSARSARAFFFLCGVRCVRRTLRSTAVCCCPRRKSLTLILSFQLPCKQAKLDEAAGVLNEHQDRAFGVLKGALAGRGERETLLSGGKGGRQMRENGKTHGRRRRFRHPRQPESSRAARTTQDLQQHQKLTKKRTNEQPRTNTKTASNMWPRGQRSATL